MVLQILFPFVKYHIAVFGLLIGEADESAGQSDSPKGSQSEFHKRFHWVFLLAVAVLTIFLTG